MVETKLDSRIIIFGTIGHLSLSYLLLKHIIRRHSVVDWLGLIGHVLIGMMFVLFFYDDVVNRYNQEYAVTIDDYDKNKLGVFGHVVLFVHFLAHLWPTYPHSFTIVEGLALIGHFFMSRKYLMGKETLTHLAYLCLGIHYVLTIRKYHRQGKPYWSRACLLGLYICFILYG